MDHRTLTYSYYYNRVPGKDPCRNNLIYTSYISEDKKVFVQQYINDSVYHQGLNHVDPNLMYEKWSREVKFLTRMIDHAPDMIPEVLEIDLDKQSIYLLVNGDDLWQQSMDNNCSFDQLLPDWQDQMLNILQTHRNLGFYKYSLHPSSYFIVGGKLKSINYFFCYDNNEGPITVNEHITHISGARQEAMKTITDRLKINWNEPQTLEKMQELAVESFGNMYTSDFIERVKNVLGI